MDRMRQPYDRQSSSTSSTGTPTSGLTSPAMHHRHTRSAAGVGNVKRSQQTKAAAARLARVMATQTPGDSDDEEDDLDLYDYNPGSASSGLGLVGNRPPGTRSRSPMMPARTSMDQAGAGRSGLGMRPSHSAGSVEQQTSSRYDSSGRSSTSSSVGKISPARNIGSPSIGKISAPYSASRNRSSQSTNTAEPPVSPYARSGSSAERVQLPPIRSSSAASLEQEQTTTPVNSLRSFKSNSSLEQPLSARGSSVGRPSPGLKPITMVPSAVSVTLKSGSSGTAPETQPENRKDKKLSVDFGTFKFKDTASEPTASSALQDEIDMLQEENENLLEKLRLAEEKFEEAEVRTRQLEQQVANLGDGVSLEARLLSRKEAALQQREEALKAASINHRGKGGEVASLRLEAETARDEADSAFEQLNAVTAEFKSLRTMTQRMILTQEEMEEVVLKRCWLSRYWSLCVRHGIHAEIASARYEYWSAFAPLPVEVVLSAAQRKEEGGVTNDADEREKILQRSDDISGDGSVENMLLVDKGLKELTSLKVEEALVIAMAQKRRAASATSTVTDELKLPIEGKNYSEGFELTEEEQEDVTFKQAWLAYFWRRVKSHGLEPDIADERLQYWLDRMAKSPVSNDAVDVERGHMELKKLAIEMKLWEISRLSIDPDSSKKTLLDFDT